MELSDIKDRLATLWKEKVEIKKRLGKIDAEIVKIQTQLDIVYIGITKDLKTRIYQHKRTKKIFDSYQVISIFNDRFYALKEENKLIIKHKPKYNKQSF